MTVRVLFHLYKQADPYHSALRRRAFTEHLLDLRLNRLPTHTPTNVRRLQTALHPRPYNPRLRALAKHRDFARPRRTCSFYTDSGS